MSNIYTASLRKLSKAISDLNLYRDGISRTWKGRAFQSLLTRLEKKLKAGFDETGLDRNKQEPLLEAERFEFRVNSFLRSRFGYNPFLERD